MPQSKILIDTNTYIRLAKSIHPLLDTPFGDEDYCLYVLKELDYEFSRSARLQTQYSWVGEHEFQTNRKKRLTLSKKNKREIELTLDFLHQHKIENRLSVSEVDILYLAYGYVLDIYTVSDDTDMLELADVFNIKTMKTQELLYLMLECDHVDMEKVRQITAYWEYISDKPANFRQDYIDIFGEKPP